MQQPDQNSQSVLLKQKELELQEATQKLHDRDQTLSRINQELYKKNLELIEEKRKAEALLYNVNEAVLVTDTSHKILLFNRAAQSLLGVKEEEVSDKKFKDIVNVSDEHGTQITGEKISTMLEYKSGIKMAGLILKRQDGRDRYVNITASKVGVDKDLILYVIIITDVTEEIRTEKAREEFISIASHELRTPMTIIKNYLWMLENKKGGELSEKQMEYIKKAETGTDRMIKLIHDMLDISRMELGKYEINLASIDLGQLVGEVVSDFRIKAAQKGLDLTVEVSDQFPKVSADLERLREVLVNLIGNSFKFTDKGFVKVKVEKDGKSAKISIIDSGKGIDKDDLPKLFHKFGRLDNSYVTVAEQGGTGLGLYIVKSIIEAMGGKVGVASEGAGKGATFWFTLRIADVGSGGELH